MNLLKIDSEKRDSGTSTDFKLKLQHPIQRGENYQLIHAHIPQTQYNIDQFNNFFVFNEGGSDLSAVLSPGYYNATQLMAELKSAMEIAGSGSNTYTIGISPTQYNLTITGSAVFSIKMADVRSACKPLGFSSNTGTSLSHTADHFVNMEIENSLEIDINGIVECDSINFGSTFSIPITVNPMQVQEYGPNKITVQTVTFTAPCHRLEIRVKNSKNRTVDLRGSNWYMILKRVE
jgi:hypothetical protein